MKNLLSTKTLLFLFLSFTGFFTERSSVLGQDLADYVSTPEITESSQPVRAFNGLYVGNGQSTSIVGKNELMMFISHRFGKVNGGIYEMFGLDEATMRLGFDYGFLPWLSVGFGRSTWEKTWDLRFKAKFLSQSSSGAPVTAVLYGQASYNSLKSVFPADQDDFSHRMTYSAQALFSRKFKHFSLQLAPIYLYSVYDPVLAGQADIFSLGMAASVKISKIMSATLEYYAGIMKPDDLIKDPLTLGLEFDTGGHLFQLVLGNAQGMIDKALLLHTTDSWTDGGIYFGFNLVRTFY